MLNVGEEVVDLNEDTSSESSNDELWAPTDSKVFRLRCPQTHKKVWELDASVVKESDELKIQWKPHVSAHERLREEGLDRLIPLESSWLSSNRSMYWADVVSRISKATNEELVSDAKRYLEHEKEKARVNGANSFQLRQSAMSSIAKELQSEVVLEMIRDCAEQVMKLSILSIDALSRSVLRSLVNIDESNQRFLKRSGKLHFLRGAVEDFVVNRNGFLNESEGGGGPRRKGRGEEPQGVRGAGFGILEKYPDLVLQLPDIAQLQQRVLPPVEAKPLATGKDLLLVDSSRHPIVDLVSQQSFLELECEHMRGFTAQRLSLSPLLAMNGTITALQCVALRDQQESLVVAANHHGHLSVWKVSWTKDTAELAGQSNPSTKTDRSPAVQLECSADNLSFLVRSKKGRVEVWDVETLFKRPADPPVRGCSFLCQPPGSSGLGAERTFSMNLADMAYFFPDSIPRSLSAYPPARNFVQDLKQRLRLSSSPVNKLRTPTACCFLPIYRTNGRAVSILVGSSDGDIFKFNLDYSERYTEGGLQDPSLAFVDKEFVNPFLSPQGHFLQSTADRGKGHHVFREVFHFHTQPILSLQVVRALGERDPVIRFLSLDRGGQIALWQYSPRYFHGVCWFVPQSTARLIYDIVEFTDREGEDFVLTEAPSEERRKSWRCSEVRREALLASQLASLPPPPPPPPSSSSLLSSGLAPRPPSSPPRTSSPRPQPGEDRAGARRQSTLSLSPRRAANEASPAPVMQSTMGEEGGTSVVEEGGEGRGEGEAGRLSPSSPLAPLAPLEEAAAAPSPASSKGLEASLPADSVQAAPLSSSQSLDRLSPATAGEEDRAEDSPPPAVEGEAASPIPTPPEEEEEEHSVHPSPAPPSGREQPDSPSGEVRSQGEGEAVPPAPLPAALLPEAVPEASPQRAAAPLLDPKPPPDCNLAVTYHPVLLRGETAPGPAPTEAEAQAPQDVSAWYAHRCLWRVSGITGRLETSAAPLWQRKRVDRRAFGADFVSLVPSSDGVEAALVLRDPQAVHRLYLVRLVCSSLAVGRPSIPCLLSEGEHFVALATGPVMLETVTRVALVLTSRCLRVFSLHTARELEVDWKDVQACIAQHQPQHVSLCPSQRLLVLFSGRDRQAHLFSLRHGRDGQAEASMMSSRPDPVHAAVLRTAQELLPQLDTQRDTQRMHTLAEVAVPTVLVGHSAQSSSSPPLQADDSLVDLVHALVWEAVEEALQESDEAQSDRLRGQCIADVFGQGPLGAIPPTTWPPGRLAVWTRRREEGAVREMQARAEEGCAEDVLGEGLREMLREVAEEEGDRTELERQEADTIGLRILHGVVDELLRAMIEEEGEGEGEGKGEEEASDGVEAVVEGAPREQSEVLPFEVLPEEAAMGTRSEEISPPEAEPAPAQDVVVEDLED